MNANWPPPGYLFTTCGRHLFGRFVLLGQNLAGWSPLEAADAIVHVGVVDDFPYVWEADVWRGVVRRPLGQRSNVRFWHPPREESLCEQDYDRAFELLRSHRGRPYDWRWIVTFGNKERPRRDICTELAKAYLDALTQRIGGWAGESLRPFAPNQIPRLLDEVSAGRGDG